MLLIFSTRPVMHFTVTNDENLLKPKRFCPWSSFCGESLKWLFVGVVDLFEIMEVGMFCMFRGLHIVGSVRNRTVSVDPLVQKERTIISGRLKFIVLQYSVLSINFRVRSFVYSA